MGLAVQAMKFVCPEGQSRRITKPSVAWATERLQSQLGNPVLTSEKMSEDVVQW